MALATNGTLINQTSPSPQITNFSAIAAGYSHNLALVGSSGSDLAQPVFQTLPRTITPGQPTTFISISQAGAPASYQWQFNGQNLAGATKPALFIPRVDWMNAGTYRVVVSNAFGVAVGQPMVLTVAQPLQFDSSSPEPSMTENGFCFRVQGSSGGGSVVIYASSDLLTWQPILTNPPAIGPIDFTDPSACGQGKRFYRATEIATPSP